MLCRQSAQPLNDLLFMSFKFNFNVANAVDAGVKDAEASTQRPVRTTSNKTPNGCAQAVIPAEFIKLNALEVAPSASNKSKLEVGTQAFILFDDESQAGRTSKGSDSEVYQIAAEVDVLPGTYEGGFKVWECTHDLILYLQKSWFVRNAGEAPANVLDLGCGRGLCGLSVLMHWDDCMVTFQDLNKEVLIRQTMANVLASAGEAAFEQRCRFLCGDWSCSKGELGENAYDLILTAETLYSPSSYHDLAEIFVNALKQNTRAAVLLSAKKYYFGLGGGTEGFIAFVETEQKYKGLLKATVLQSIDDGKSNIREIVMLSPKLQPNAS